MGNSVVGGHQLTDAAAKGQLVNVKGLLDGGVSVNACAPVSSFNCQLRFIDTQLLQDEDRLTALHMAAMNGQVEVVKLLLSRNALPAVKTSVSNKIIGIYSLNKQRFHT
jgi:ankyrin repeat protein